jgi:Uma2 family endonuclease
LILRSTRRLRQERRRKDQDAGSKDRRICAVATLFAALDIYVRAEHLGRVLFSPSDVELEPEFLSQPDLFVVSTDEWRRLRNERIIRSLTLAIEVLSPSSSRHDRVRKRPKYQRHVSEYWIVDLDGRLFERWRPDDERPEILTTALVWQPAGVARPFELDLAGYFADVLHS